MGTRQVEKFQVKLISAVKSSVQKHTPLRLVQLGQVLRTKN
jgi:hypothetical protein